MKDMINVKRIEGISEEERDIVVNHVKYYTTEEKERRDEWIRITDCKGLLMNYC